MKRTQPYLSAAHPHARSQIAATRAGACLRLDPFFVSNIMMSTDFYLFDTARLVPQSSPLLTDVTLARAPPFGVFIGAKTGGSSDALLSFPVKRGTLRYAVTPAALLGHDHWMQKKMPRYAHLIPQ